jgi:hypothetical protein
MSKRRLWFISLIAYSLFGLDIVCNVIFYSQFAGGFGSVFYATTGLLFDLAKVASIILFVYFVRQFEQFITETTICTVIWFVLSLLSLGATYDLLSQLNNEYEVMPPKDSIPPKDSPIYAQHKSAIDNAQTKRDELASANVNTAAITAQITLYRGTNDALFSTLGKNTIGQSTGRTKGQITAQCSEDNWYTRHYCGKWLSHHAEIQQLQVRLHGYQPYQSAFAHHQTAQNAFSELAIIGAANQAHPSSVNVGKLTHNSSVKGFIILLASLLVELLTSGLMFVRSKVVLGPLPTLNPPVNTIPFIPPTEIDTHTPSQPRSRITRSIRYENK